MPTQLLDNKLVNIEIFPDNPGASKVPNSHSTPQDAAAAAQQKSKSTAAGAQEKANSTANAAQEKAQGVQQQATSTAQGWSDTAQKKGAELQGQAGQYQTQASDTMKGYGDTAEQSGHAYVQSGSDAANSAAKNNLPESMHGYAGTAVDYAGNFATGTVGTLAGGLKDTGDTVGNIGYDSVAGLGKVGYNLGSGLGSAVMGKKKEPQTKSVKQETESTAEESTEAATKPT